MQEISKLAKGVNRLSEIIRMLTINGQIDAARVGMEGAGFRVIASELHELSRTVREINESIQDLASGFVELISGIAEGASSLLVARWSASRPSPGQPARPDPGGVTTGSKKSGKLLL